MTGTRKEFSHRALAGAQDPPSPGYQLPVENEPISPPLRKEARGQARLVKLHRTSRTLQYGSPAGRYSNPLVTGAGASLKDPGEWALPVFLRFRIQSTHAASGAERGKGGAECKGLNSPFLSGAQGAAPAVGHQ
ncbi:catenin delta-2-like [Platysternon megacephalum]|uniref:Catenin delta-2-like n=1 Tax=Platysternon megacephalum TaxID=55544 RepID=A0A4D9EA50_9SAUR|nr:catenin delta-2-like [Platysternon megacephalum]